MPVPGYDPEDLDDVLETKLSADEKREYLSDDQWASYERGDASLLDLLDDEAIERLLERASDSSP